MTAIDYDAWAKKYDDTRGASPNVLRSLAKALGFTNRPPPLGKGGGHGHLREALSEAGFSVTLCDYSPEMARRALGKLNGAGVAVADAAHLPFRDAPFDCAISVNVLGHDADWNAMLREARSVVRGGPFVMKASTHETLEANWVVEYLPGIRDHAPAHHYQPEAVIVEALREAGFSRLELSRVRYTDSVDGSLQASMLSCAIIDPGGCERLSHVTSRSCGSMGMGRCLWRGRKDCRARPRVRKPKACGAHAEAPPPEAQSRNPPRAHRPPPERWPAPSCRSAPTHRGRIPLRALGSVIPWARVLAEPQLRHRSH